MYDNNRLYVQYNLVTVKILHPCNCLTQ